MISWITNSDLGILTPNTAVTKILTATSNSGLVFYTIAAGKLPPGLDLSLYGIISGEVNLIYDYDTEGITKFDSGNTTFDNSSTNIDATFTFTVTAIDPNNFESANKEFVFTVINIAYKNVIAKPLLSKEQRNIWNEFINNNYIFPPKYIYEPDNKQFGIQRELNMLVLAGVEKTNVIKYISAMRAGNRTKRFTFGQLKVARAVLPQTNPAIGIYEVVYLIMKDSLEYNNIALPDRVKLSSMVTSPISADNDCDIYWTRDFDELNDASRNNVKANVYLSVDNGEYLVSDPLPTVYSVNSITNWRNRIRDWRNNDEVLNVERNYLPYWMRSSQLTAKQEMGFTPSVVLCYCLPGSGTKIVKNIQKHMADTKFTFNQLDFVVNRYVVDDHIIFKNDIITIN
jgi:hypothetical protein